MSRKTNNASIGFLGESIACSYLQKRGVAVLERNYRKKYGEIDIVTRGTDGSVRFVEVKTVSYETKDALMHAVSHETWRPEEKVHQFKLHQIHKAAETWILERGYTGNWQVDVVAVRVVPRERYASVKLIENVSI